MEKTNEFDSQTNSSFLGNDLKVDHKVSEMDTLDLI